MRNNRNIHIIHPHADEWGIDAFVCMENRRNAGWNRSDLYAQQSWPTSSQDDDKLYDDFFRCVHNDGYRHRREGCTDKFLCGAGQSEYSRENYKLTDID
jgi:hypothetical protein